MPGMRRERLEITNELGLHLRASNQLVQLAQQFESDIRVFWNGRVADGKRILDLILKGPTWNSFLESRGTSEARGSPKNGRLASSGASRAKECRPMIEILDQGPGKVLGMRVGGKLAHQDYEQFVPLLEKLIEQHGSVRCLVEMADLHGIELRAMWDEIKFDVCHSRQIERCAVVGDRAWEAWMTRLSRPIFMNAEIRFFELIDREKAWVWIREGL